MPAPMIPRPMSTNSSTHEYLPMPAMDIRIPATPIMIRIRPPTRSLYQSLRPAIRSLAYHLMTIRKPIPDNRYPQKLPQVTHWLKPEAATSKISPEYTMNRPNITMLTMIHAGDHIQLHRFIQSPQYPGAPQSHPMNHGSRPVR